MPTCVADAGAAVVDGRFYVPGGLPCVDELHCSPATHCYDVAAGRWDPGCAPMPEARGHHGVAALHGEVWAVGGGVGDGAPLPLVHVYSPRSNAWRGGVLLPHASAYGSCAVLQCS